MNKILTFSIAAYNVEAFLDQLMESVIASGEMDRVEILIVDDGSKDRTAEIAAQYEKQYPESVRLITKENGGHGSTINTGMQNASGKYFRALDGDDWVDSDTLAQLIPVLEARDEDMIVCDYKKCFSDGRVLLEQFHFLEPEKTYRFEDAALKEDWFCYHTIIYKTEILKSYEIRLDENCFYVDTEYDLFPIPYVNSLFYFHKPLYCYRLGLTEQSVSPESKMKHIDNGLTVANRLIRMCSELDDSLSNEKKSYILSGTADHCIWYIRALLIFPYSAEKRKEIKAFDRRIKSVNPALYREMENRGKESRLIKILRKSGYSMYGVVKIYKNTNDSY